MGFHSIIHDERLRECGIRTCASRKANATVGYKLCATSKKTIWCNDAPHDEHVMKNNENMSTTMKTDPPTRDGRREKKPTKYDTRAIARQPTNQRHTARRKGKRYTIIRTPTPP